jgi:hypothetical protein
VPIDPRDEQTYWILPMDLFDPRQSDPVRYRALFTYIVLFAGSVVFSDSAVVGDRRFRLALRADVDGSGDGFTRELVDRGYLRFAIRERGGVAVSLADTASGIAERSGEYWVGYEPLGETEFHYVEQHGNLISYNLDGAAQRFQHEALRIFSRSFETGGLPETYRRAFVSVMQEMIADQRPFGLAEFCEGSSLWKRVMKRTGKPHLFERYGDYVYSVARGPHATFLPERLGINPTYSPTEKLAIDRWRGRDQDEPNLVEQRTVRTRALRLADFVDGLRHLTGADVDALRTSDERLAYDGLLRDFALGKAGSDEVLGGLLTYRRRVEDRIMIRIRSRPAEETEFQGSVNAFRAVGTELVRWVFVDGLAMLADQATLGAFGRVRYVWDRLHEFREQERLTMRNAAEQEDLRKQFEAAEAEKDGVVEGLLRAENPAVEAALIVDKPGVRDFSVIVRP